MEGLRLNKSELPALAERLYARRGEAVHVQYVSVRIDDWQPEPNNCHENATRWCIRNPSYAVVRGWRVGTPKPGIYMFFAHSVVQAETGDLIDLTPPPSPFTPPFLKHEPADGDFDEIVGGLAITVITHMVVL